MYIYIYIDIYRYIYLYLYTHQNLCLNCILFVYGPCVQQRPGDSGQADEFKPSTPEGLGAFGADSNWVITGFPAQEDVLQGPSLLDCGFCVHTIDMVETTTASSSERWSATLQNADLPDPRTVGVDSP